MLYKSYQGYANWIESVQRIGDATQSAHTQWMQLIGLTPLPHLDAQCEQIKLMGLTHTRPAFNIHEVVCSKGVTYGVEETTVFSTPFCGLLRFKRLDKAVLPKVLLVAPMSGHFATLLAGTVKTLLKDHEVYLTDWKNIRNVSSSEGRFDLDAYTGHIIEFMQFLGPGAHLMGVCQPTVSCLAATAVMAERKDPCQPVSLTLMAGPVDARINPTAVNKLANDKPFEWFEQKLIDTVPPEFAGAGRRVYPGFMQLIAFMSMNPDRHRESFKNLYTNRLDGEHQKANAIRDFYEEYFAIMDLSADFYLETIKHVFQEYALAKGTLTYQGQKINLKAIKRPFLLTVEGERDDICGIGQTLAAQDLCSGLPAYKKSHHLQAGVGHYGVFNGKRWEAQIYPVVRNMIQSVN